MIAPGTPLAAKPPRWVVAGSLIETTRLYARMVAAVEPGWIEAAGEHLVKRTRTEPHWVAGRGFVAAFESVSLYGLTLASRRRINYGAIEPREARGIFIREALLAAESRVRGDFLHANRALKREIEALEARIRRRDILADERAQEEFYAARIPERISSIAAFEHWRANVERRQPRLLYMSRADLMTREAPETGTDGFPDHWTVGGNRLPLEYRFEPGEPLDGITLVVPEPLLDRLHADQLAWLVPGWRVEKVAAVLRCLPKALRKQLVPVPEHARAAVADQPQDPHGGAHLGTAAASPAPGFFEWLAAWITRRIGSQVSAFDLSVLPLPEHLRINIRVVDEQDRMLAQGRDLAALRRKLGAIATGSTPVSGAGSVRASGASAGARAGSSNDRDEPAPLHRQWDFGELAPSIQIERNRLHLILYPALEDRVVGVARVDVPSADEAERLTREAIVRLCMLALPQQVRYIGKRMADDRELVLLSRGLPLAGSVTDTLTRRAFRESFLPQDSDLPRDATAFTRLLEGRRASLAEIADRLAVRTTSLFSEWRAVRAGLEGLKAPAFAAARADIARQLEALLPPDFIDSLAQPWFDYLPRYLKAIQRRMERLPAHVPRDAQLSGQLRPFIDGLRTVTDQTPRRVLPAAAQLRWMIEEFRVSLFAQDLKTVLRVSEKRLAEQLEAARAEART